MTDIVMGQKELTLQDQMEVNRQGFIGAVLEAIRGYYEHFGMKPRVIRVRAPYFDGMQAEFERLFNTKHALEKVNGVPIERMSKIYKYDMEVL